MLVLAVSSSAIPFDRRPHRHLHRQVYNPPSAPPAQPTYYPPSAPPAQPNYNAPSAAPAPSGATSDGGTFQIQVSNNCGTDMQFGIYQITSDFAMNQITAPVNIASGGQGSIAAPYQGVGMRLSGNAGSADQWSPQALFEFGYSTYGGVSGTAYDLSVMAGSDPATGIAVYPENPQCPSKVCSPGACAAGQGWTNPNQAAAGSPADTVCYHGKTNFRVVWCP